jgi:hypothetical protein
MATKRKASMYNDEQTPPEPWASPSRQRARFDFAPESPEQEDGSVVSSRHSGIEPAEVTHSRTPSTAQEAPANAATQDRKQKFLQVVASNVSFRKTLRRVASSYNSYVRGYGYLKYAEGGLVYYQNCIRNTEQDVNKPQAEMARLRLLNANQKWELEKRLVEKRTVKNIKTGLMDKHARRSDHLYESIDLTRADFDLKCLTTEF